MGHRNKESLVKQIQDVFDSKLAIGESKHQAKLDGTAKDKIFSWSTYNAYMKHANYFASFCKQNYGCKTLDQCRTYADTFLTARANLSPWTVKLEASALAKLYGCTTKDFITTDKRSYDDITRSRKDAVRDKHFSEEKNRDYVDLCRGIGCRSDEAKCLRGSDLVYKDSKPYVHFTRGTKGGRERYSPVVGPHADRIVAMFERAGDNKVIEKVPNGADTHGYRRDYATSVYFEHARDLETCKKDKSFYNKEHFNGKGKPKGGFDKDAVYRRRGKHVGEWLDKRAMLIASEALGHNRISVVGQHYIDLG